MSLTGTVRPHRRGFGFVNLDAPTEGPNGPVDSLFIPPPALVDLVDGDRVVCEGVDEGRGKGLTAENLVLVSRTRRLLVGLLVEKQGRLMLRPDPALANRDWTVPDDLLPRGAKAGRGCVLTIGEASLDGSLRRCGALVAGPVDVSSWRWLRLLAATRHLGAIDRSDPTLAADADAALAADLAADPQPDNGVDPAGSEGTAEPAGAGGTAEPAGSEGTAPSADPLAEVRVERTGQACCTIDGPGTRDLDDAIYAERLDSGATRVSVHIADAAATVGPGSELDRRARTRATSTYLASGGWPMLPRHLSEGALSLRPGRPRLALTVAFTVGAGGEVGEVEVSASTVCSAARLTYAQVEGWLTGEPVADADDGAEVTPLAEVAEAVKASVFAAHEAAERIGAHRLARGAGSGGLFTEAEARPGVDGDRVTLQRVVPTPMASRLIERLMVAANEAVAGWLLHHGAPALYRVQPAPDPERLQQLVGLLATVGLRVDVEALADPSATEALVDAAADAGLERTVVAGLVAQGMQRAGYETDPGSHFGLASGAYVHFTSPIRRYADLVVHRAAHAVLGGDPGAGPTAAELGTLAGWLDHRAGAVSRAERFELKLLWADVLQRTLAGGRPYKTTALIGAVRRAGLRIRVDRFDLVGTVPSENLAPGNAAAYVQAPDELSATVGEVTYRVGDRIRVAIDEADRSTGDLDFAPL
ncbi:MAG TPA: ribonuclease R family protein [Acidimicrobiales bacterium]|nr:ribonuclease R family protein [Acidimicrobiales bacterium]